MHVILSHLEFHRLLAAGAYIRIMDMFAGILPCYITSVYALEAKCDVKPSLMLTAVLCGWAAPV